MPKSGTRREASPRVISMRAMSRFTVTGVAVQGSWRPLPRSLNLAMGMAGGFGSDEFVGVGRAVVNETCALSASSQVWSV